jgi:hypothetical protein
VPVPALAARVPDPSSAAFGKIGEAFAAEVHKFAKKNGIPVRHFAKGEKKEEVVRPVPLQNVASGLTCEFTESLTRPGGTR